MADILKPRYLGRCDHSGCNTAGILNCAFIANVCQRCGFTYLFILFLNLHISKKMYAFLNFSISGSLILL